MCQRGNPRARQASAMGSGGRSFPYNFEQIHEEVDGT
jgi:hypothetical protein